MEYIKEFEAVLRVCKRLDQKNLLAATDGNISVRLGDGLVGMTPSGQRKAEITLEMMSVVSLEGQVISGAPSSELAMHLSVYRNQPKAQAIIHAHPPHLIAWTLAHPESRSLPLEHPVSI